MKNKLYNFFAFVGFITCFIIACSASSEIDDFDDMDDQGSGTTNKYAISTMQNRNERILLVVTNTETGVTKGFIEGENRYGWKELEELRITFNH